MNLEECKAILHKNEQEQLIKFYDELSTKEQQCLLNQIEKINFTYMNSLFKNKDVLEIEDKDISNLEAIDKEKINKEKYKEIGIEQIKQGKLAVCSMAGGQGTRLGFDGPKGTYLLELDKPTSIFEIEVNKLKAAKEKYGIYIYWYIMTSIQNHEETIKFFEKNQYFNYPKDHIIFFNQGELPLLDKNGKIVLKDKSNIFMAPDGNGGIFKALGEEGIITHMKDHKIEYLAIGNVDNILIRMVDPIILGLIMEKNVELASKSFMKPSPDGKWGVFCKINGKPRVIEYIEIPKELLEARNIEGELIFGDAHFGCNYFNISLLERIVSEKLPMHAACKKNKVITEGGEIELIDTYKFEAFIFDAFSATNDILVFRVKKDEEFAPIKNKEGDESPATAIALYNKKNN